MEFINVIEALVALALAVAAVTPTKSDDAIVGRIANLWGLLRGKR